MRTKHLLLAFFLLLIGTVKAQPERRNWRFGIGAGLAFLASGPPAVTAGSALTSVEACSAISDANGMLLCYTNAEQVWDRNNAPMPNGALRFGNVSAT